MGIPADERPCPPERPARPKRSERPIEHPLIARITVAGLRCVHCETRVQNALMAIPDVVGARAHVDRGVVEVLFDPSRLTVDRLAAAVESAADGSPRHYQVTAREVLS